MTVYEDWVSKENDGRSGMFNRIEVRDAVIVVPILEDCSLIMVENYRHGADKNLLELPGGFINENEAESDAARRELLEETGYTCNKVESINTHGQAELHRGILLFWQRVWKNITIKI
jgi:8-oxo-dGTP pyrophosphatase MutT (NUDIX family)